MFDEIVNLIHINFISILPKPSPSEGLGVARAATERARGPLVLAPEVSVVFEKKLSAQNAK